MGKIICENGEINIVLSEDTKTLILECVSNSNNKSQLSLYEESIDILIDKLEELQKDMDMDY